jgi:SpoVK/Ycf46/Vps4 family AAA+-type ATPase
MMCQKLVSLDPTYDLDEIVMKTPGYVGADLSALLDEALVAALNRLSLTFIRTMPLNEHVSICFI